MRRILLILSLFLIFCINNIKAQEVFTSKAKVVDVMYSIVGDKVYISYDIIKAKPNDIFFVSLKAFNELDEEILMSTLTGDIDTISPGLNKRVIWHIDKDLYQLDENVYIEVSAELLTPKILNPINKKQAYLYSTLLPGYGTYRLSSKKYHLVKGVVAYGLVAASVYNGIKADDYYEDYQNSTDAATRESLYKNANNKKDLASIYAIGALSIWLAEYVNIYLAKNNVLKKNVELGVRIDNYSNSPLISLNFKL